MLKKIIITGLPLILLLVILQPVVYFIWDWLRQNVLATPTSTSAIVITLLVVVFARFASPLLERIEERRFVAGLLALFLVSRLVWILAVPTLPISDFETYNRLAGGVSRGQYALSSDAWVINGWGYPLFLGLVYRIFGAGNVMAGEIANLALGLVSTVLIYLLAKEISGARVARWTGLLFVLWPVQMMYSSVLATEHLALPFSLGGLILAVQVLKSARLDWPRAVAGGVLLALGAITRPTILLFAAAFAGVALAACRPVRKGILLTAALVGGYLLMNGLYLGSLYIFNQKTLPTTNVSTGMSIYMGTKYPNGMWDPVDLVTVQTWLHDDRFLDIAIRASIDRLASYSPRQLFTLYAQKNYIFWASPYYGLVWSTVRVRDPAALAALPTRELESSQYLFQLAVLAAAIWGIVLALRKGYQPQTGLLFLILLGGALFHLVLVTDSRYLYVFQPVLLILAARGLTVDFSISRAGSTIASTLEEYGRERSAHWDEVARRFEKHPSAGRYYQQRLGEIYRFLVMPNSRVLELGCGQGDLLASLQPSYGVGIDFSPEMVRLARQKHPELHILQADAHQLDLLEKFDVVILSDLVNDVWDVQVLLEKVARLCTPHTRVILNFYSRLWEPVLSAAQSLGLARPMELQNWLTVEDINMLLYLAGFETLRTWREILWPLPLLGFFFNRFLAKLWPFNLLDLTTFVIARQHYRPPELPRPVVSVIVPARNEEGNVPAIFERIPEMGGGTEIVFVEGNSRDHTYEAIVQYAAAHPEKRCKIYKQDGKGKGDAVRKGFAAASGEVLMILDADLTVPPEDLPRFYEALVSNKGEMINGVRLVYPMEKEAMRFANLLGNKFFSLAFSWLMGQSLKDTLCGTKVMWKSDYNLVAANRSYFGDFDPFGDYDLLFGAARLNLKIVDLPIRYRERTYGTTNIQRWRHGVILLRMTAFAALRLKFI